MLPDSGQFPRHPSAGFWISVALVAGLVGYFTSRTQPASDMIVRVTLRQTTDSGGPRGSRCKGEMMRHCTCSGSRTGSTA
jgi:hypothetical protein